MKKIVIFIALIIGALLSLQVRSFKKVEFLIQRSEPANILAELRVFQLANQKLREQLKEDENALNEVQTKVAHTALDQEIAQLRLLSGEEAVTGEGVEITLSVAVQEFWISDLIAQLVSAGAEAVSINDIRITAYTGGVRTVGGGFILGQHFLRSPFRITVVGPKKELQQALSTSGGIVDRLQRAYPKLTLLLAQREAVSIPAVLK